MSALQHIFYLFVIALALFHSFIFQFSIIHDKNGTLFVYMPLYDDEDVDFFVVRIEIVVVTAELFSQLLPLTPKRKKSL